LTFDTLAVEWSVGFGTVYNTDYQVDNTGQFPQRRWQQSAKKLSKLGFTIVEQDICGQNSCLRHCAIQPVASAHPYSCTAGLETPVCVHDSFWNV